MSTYNGHPSYAHWNVALWLYNDEPLYRLVQSATRRAHNAARAAEDILDELHAVGTKATPDGVEYTEELIEHAIAEEFEHDD